MLLLPVQTAIGNPCTDLRLHISQHKKCQKKTTSSAWLPGASTTIAIAGFDWIKHDPQGLLYIFPMPLPTGSIIGVVGGRVVYKGSKWQNLLEKTELQSCIQKQLGRHEPKERVVQVCACDGTLLVLSQPIPPLLRNPSNKKMEEAARYPMQMGMHHIKQVQFSSRNATVYKRNMAL